jgi:predicted SnoaL-like aldol condensation-catalyzing enzyme
LKAVHAEEMVVHNSPLGGDAVGRDALYEQNKVMFEKSASLNLTPYHVIANDDTVIVVANVTGVRRDVRLNQVVLEIWRMENNQCVEVWDHFSDQKAWDEFWND